MVGFFFRIGCIVEVFIILIGKLMVESVFCVY